MLLISLDKRAADCRIELDGVDISRLVCRVELDADVSMAITRIRLTLVDHVTVIGEAGRFEFIHRKADGSL